MDWPLPPEVTILILRYLSGVDIKAFLDVFPYLRWAAHRSITSPEVASSYCYRVGNEDVLAFYHTTTSIPTKLRAWECLVMRWHVYFRIPHTPNEEHLDDWIKRAADLGFTHALDAAKIYLKRHIHYIPEYFRKTTFQWIKVNSKDILKSASEFKFNWDLITVEELDWCVTNTGKTRYDITKEIFVSGSTHLLPFIRSIHGDLWDTLFNISISSSRTLPFFQLLYTKNKSAWIRVVHANPLYCYTSVGKDIREFIVDVGNFSKKSLALMWINLARVYPTFERDSLRLNERTLKKAVPPCLHRIIRPTESLITSLLDNGIGVPSYWVWTALRNDDINVAKRICGICTPKFKFNREWLDTLTHSQREWAIINLK